MAGTGKVGVFKNLWKNSKLSKILKGVGAQAPG